MIKLTAPTLLISHTKKIQFYANVYLLRVSACEFKIYFHLISVRGSVYNLLILSLFIILLLTS
jgi:hypothetical protein